MHKFFATKQPFRLRLKFKPLIRLNRGLKVALAVVCFFVLPVFPQQTNSVDSPVVVQPGAPGQPTKILPAATRAKLPPISPKDVEFMQGMIHHHAQAVEMVALMESRTENKKLRLFGARISHTQADEIVFMKRWLSARVRPISMQMPKKAKIDMKDMDHPKHEMTDDHMMMPGMLTPEQMEGLAKAQGAEFDRLFLTGMIQHHDGALIMVKDLFDTAGAGQDAEMFNFATDVDSSQRAEIRRMETMLGNKPQKEKK